MKYLFLILAALLLLFSCDKEEEGINLPYTVSGRVVNSAGMGMEGVKIWYSAVDFTLSDASGDWLINDLNGPLTIAPFFFDYDFNPVRLQVNGPTNDVLFIGSQDSGETEVEEKILNWFAQQQLSNGLLESVEGSDGVSLYDNALAAMVFMQKGNFTRAESIFDFFAGRISTELNNGVGGFSQFRDSNGVPNNHRWMGDNAWLLIALNNYQHLTGRATYVNLAFALSNWLMGLQDTDGGLFAGYDYNGELLDFKVTEGNIDAFNAIQGYTDFHRELLAFLENDRWDDADKNLVAWPGNPSYLFALDLHSWGYSIFNDYPVSALATAQRFLTTQTATNGARITGYCFDEDQDTVWPEGTGQMALAFGLAGMNLEKERYLVEMEKVLLQSTEYDNAAGFPYATNPGTVYGAGELWPSAFTEISISGGAWYVFAKNGFNPFAVGRNKAVPSQDMFWLD